MTTVNHECYVDLEVANLLKEAGFDWGVQSFYIPGALRKLQFIECGCTYFEDCNIKADLYSAPTLTVAQRWLREVKEMYAEAYLSESHHTPVWIAEVYLWENRPLGRELRDKCLCTGIGPVYFDTYEEALEAAINKCLTILLEE